MSANGLRPYPAYKDSGVDWLGDVPEHWAVLPGRACFVEKATEPNLGLRETTVLSLSYGRIVVKPPEKLHGLVPASFETYQVVDPFDIVVRPTDLQNDWNSLRFGLSRFRGIITSAYMCLQTNGRLARQYGFLLLHTYDLMKIFYGLGSGLRQNLRWSDFRYLPCCIPPLPDQRAIVRFLDHADRRIQRYIRAKERLIELLEERKRALIHEAVTGRIDVRTGQPYPAYKDSGVEWVGEVPEHWEVRPNKSVLSRRKVLVGEDHPEFDLLSLTKGGVIVRDLSTGQGKFSADPGTCQEVRVGDLVFCLFDVPETPRTVGLSAHHGMITGAYTILECPDRLLQRFLEAFYIAMDDRKLLAPLYSGLRNTIPPSSLLRAKTPVPPVLEQRAIARFLDVADRRIRRHISATQSQIALLKEYRTRLIADVATGKLDVREAAADLPETDPLATNRDGTEVIPTESNLQPTAHDMAKEAVP